MTKTNSLKISWRLGLAVMIIMAFSVMAFSACGGGTKLVGTWKLDRVVSGGITINAVATDKGAFGDDFNNILTFNEDGSATIKIRSETASSATYTQAGSQVTVSIGSVDTTYTLSGSELTYENGDVKYFYKKSS